MGVHGQYRHVVEASESAGLDSLPAEFIERLGRLLTPEQFRRWVSCFDEDAGTTLRVNPLRGDTAETVATLRAEGFRLEPVGVADAYRVPSDQRRRLTESEAFANGAIYIQSLSSMLAVLALAPRPDEEVLDLCAAPGGKTVMMAALMANRGRIGAVEKSRPRFFRLLNNVRAQGATIVHCYHRDGASVGRKTPGRFDRVLVDAPCSSESRITPTVPATHEYWSERKIRQMARSQKRLLRSGFEALKPGGVLVYSTCTFAPEENEAVVSDLIDRFGDRLSLERVLLPEVASRDGLIEWESVSYPPALNAAVRVLPAPGVESFFFCRLRKTDPP